MRMRGFHQTAWVAAIALSLTFTLYSSATAQCEQQVEQTLRELQVPPGDVESMQIKRRMRGQNPPTNYEYNAWIRLRSCGQGYLVVNLTRYCHVKQSYTRGDCQAGGVPSY